MNTTPPWLAPRLCLGESPACGARRIKCDSVQTVTATFAEDCCDREVMA